jgi:hypothetical protein
MWLSQVPIFAGKEQASFLEKIFELYFYSLPGTKLGNNNLKIGKQCDKSWNDQLVWFTLTAWINLIVDSMDLFIILQN